MRIETFNSPPEAAMDIRVTVFVDEQGFYDEFDDIDGIATHFLVYNEAETPVATCRVFAAEDEGSFFLGRLAVRKEYRKQGFGSVAVTAAEDHLRTVGGKEILLHSQLHATPFYEKLGYARFGSVENEQGQPHVWMKKIL